MASANPGPEEADSSPDRSEEKCADGSGPAAGSGGSYARRMRSNQSSLTRPLAPKLSFQGRRRPQPVNDADDDSDAFGESQESESSSDEEELVEARNDNLRMSAAQNAAAAAARGAGGGGGGGPRQLDDKAEESEPAIFLDRRSAAEVSALVSARTNGATPLLMACRNGHLDVVEYLVDRCAADIEQPGSVTFDGETIEGAPPLWVAAAAGYLQVVRYLVRRGARVNCTTKTNSTPLRAACFDGHYDIVKYLVEHGADVEVANRHGHTCLMIACYKGHYKIARYLIEVGADVNRKSVKGNTALHDCAECGSLEILQLLLKHGAKVDVDSNGMTPLLAAAVTGHTHIVEHFVQNLDCVGRKDKVDALELLGATYVDRKRDMHGALKYWKEALRLRYESGKTPLPKPQGQSPIAAFENTVEAGSLDQLEEAVSDPDEMRMQALLVRERILGPAHPETSYYIRYRGAVYADAGNFTRCIRLWMYALDMQQSMLEPLSPMTNSSFLSFAELFSFMLAEREKDGRTVVRDTAESLGSLAPALAPAPNPSAANIPALAFADVMVVLSRAIREVKAGILQLSKLTHGDRDLTYLHRTLAVIVNLTFLLAKMQPHLTSAQDLALKKSLFDFLRLNARSRNGWTLLHLACTREAALSRYPMSAFPSAEVVTLLLQVGADPNNTDQDGNTPLHVLASNQPCPSQVVQAVLEHGGHLDRVNNQGKTFVDLLTPRPVHEIVNPVRFTTLKCLCARVVRQHRLRYKGLLPATLELFVSMH